MSDEAYCLRILRRCRVAGLRLRPGVFLRVSRDRLRVCAFLVRTGCAKPADADTERDVRLFEALRGLEP